MRIILSILFFSLLVSFSQAQLVYNENFTVAGPYPQGNLPLGWSQGKFGTSTSNLNVWDVVNTGTFPTCAPRSASTMMRFQSWAITSGESSFLASKRFDMSAIPGAGAPFSFWMYRDNGYPGVNDRIMVYVNDSATLGTDAGGATLLNEAVTTQNTINRNCALTPVAATCGAWNQYSYTIPNSFNGNSVYVIILAISSFGNNMFIDDFNITSYPAAQTYVASSAMVFNQNSSTTAPGATNQQIIGCKLTVTGQASPLALDSMIFNTNGTDNAATDIINAKLWWSGGTSVFSTANAVMIKLFAAPYATNYTFTAPWTGFTGLDVGDNYFWITYDIKATATSGNCVDAEWISGKIGTTSVTPAPQTMAGCREIDLVYCVPQYAVGCSWANYQTNDFINGVTFVGDNIPAPGISAVGQVNTIYAYAGPLCPAPFPRLCAFQSHPPDYELFPAVTSRTTSVTADGTTQYPMNLQVGTYGGGNCIAAWIDYNNDGIFNNYFDNIRKQCTGTASTSTITAANAPLTSYAAYTWGLNVGMNVSGAGIAPGAKITAINTGTRVITLSIPNTGAVNGLILFENRTAPMDEGEKVAQSAYLGSLGTHNANFFVPTWASNWAGKTRFRVREVWIDYDIDPCSYEWYGETEDYTVTIVPDCPGSAAYTTWLGFTDEWSDPANWCPAVVPMAPNPYVDVLIPGGPTGGLYPYSHPVIRAGVFARANTLRIANNDTVHIDAPDLSSLDVNDSLWIEGATSRLIVNTTLVDSAQVLNGLLAGTFVGVNMTPFKGGTAKARSFMMFSQAELLAKGLQDGDVIDTIKVHLERYANTNMAYQNFNVKMYYTNSGYVSQTPAGGGTVPPVIGAVTTVYSNANLNLASITLQPGSSTLNLPLSTPFVWDGLTANKLVVEICYENTANPNSSGFQTRYTQTPGFRNYLSLMQGVFNAAYPVPGCDMQEQSSVNATGTIGTNTITVASSANLTVGQMVTGAGIGPNTYISQINGNIITLSVNLTGSFTNSPHTFGSNIITFVSEYRPNLTFVFDRPYIKYPIMVSGHWVNNGGFTPAISRVTMDGTALQRIEGTSITSYYDLRIANPAHVVLNQDMIVTDTLHLQNGRLKLNNHLTILTNQSPGALSFVVNAGDIQSDMDVTASNVSPWGRINWDMGSTPGTRTIPFINVSGTRIPLTYNIDAGTHNVTFATYATQQNNTNIPSPTVTNIFGPNNAALGAGWGSDGWTMVDRFYMVQNTGTAPRADITFRYSSQLPVIENAQAGNANMSAQRWLNSTSLWEYPFIGGQNFSPAGVSSVLVPDYTDFTSSSWWTIVGTSTPLPVELLDFSAIPHKDKVELKWSTASEYNNSHFEIERTVDMTDFKFIDRVLSQGQSSSQQDYRTWDNNPVQGIQYYYLRQYDHDGTLTSYGPVSAKFSNNVFEIITTTIAPTDMGVTVAFNYDSDEPVSYRILDMTGRLIIAKDKQPATPGANVLDIDVSLAKGSYQIMLQNSQKVVSRKFFY